LQLEDVIIFAGSQAKVAEIYALSDVVVSSSKKPESFGRTAAEALAMNVPVVASAHGGILDIVINGVTGRHFQHGDIEGLVRGISEVNSSRPDGLRQFVGSKFTLQRMVSQTLDVYGGLAGSNKSPS